MLMNLLWLSSWIAFKITVPHQSLHPWQVTDTRQEGVCLHWSRECFTSSVTDWFLVNKNQYIIWLHCEVHLISESWVCFHYQRTSPHSMIKIGFLELYSSLVREISMSKLLSEFDLSSDVSLYLHECKSDSLVLDSLLVLISSISIPGRIAVSQRVLQQGEIQQKSINSVTTQWKLTLTSDHICCRSSTCHLEMAPFCLFPLHSNVKDDLLTCLLNRDLLAVEFAAI